MVFQDFSLEKPTSSGRCYDHVSVYDGHDERAERISYSCGNDIPGDVTSSRNTLYVVFKSDTTVKEAGFNASYAAKADVSGGNGGDNYGKNGLRFLTVMWVTVIC